MKYRMIMIAMLVSTSLYSVENENTWTIWNSGIENKCKNVLETKQKEESTSRPMVLKRNISNVKMENYRSLRNWKT
ncbi:hypothetical protein LSS_20052 [Leptospira santarosai serovar Shermani str. LT 821]|uniref:Uncharacterized protein n=1 Tax=Leptospira santarosai serovar Shermani str. LT 821 TaxID=758847 RepID=K8XU44_9LEPT|nr:hypothetical protein LSS_20052 [Leptospira santarosai serovar Shermani str. LT 821]